MKFRKLILIAIAGALFLGTLTGCTSMRNMAIESVLKDTKNGQDTNKTAAFETKFTKVLDDIKKKDDYKKIPLETNANTEWFIKQSFMLWDKQLTKEQYISNGAKKFPGYEKTFAYLADEFSK